MSWWIDGETGLPETAAEKVKARISLLERENSLLRGMISLLEEENQLLRDRINMIEGGGLGVRKAGDRIEFIPSDTATAQLTSDGYLKPVSPNTLAVGDPDNYLNDIITANITIASTAGDKEDVRDIPDDELEVELPKPKRYIRKGGRREEEIGYVAEELPPILRRGKGYDLKTLVAVLAYKIGRLEKRVSKV
ncbi:hypothetical protein HRbin01_00075 [archaeon HR01]|nr:hypothetical protein HRbin01_00075 [archaeon HR01]